MKILALLCIIISMCLPVSAQETPSSIGVAWQMGISNDFQSDHQRYDYTNTNGGLFLGTEFFVLKNRLRYSLTYHLTAEAPPDGLISQSTHQVHALFGGSIGRSVRFYYQTGLGMVWGFLRDPGSVSYTIGDYESNYRVIGVPLRIGFEKSYSPTGSIGLDLVSNFNSQKSMWGIAVSWKYGKVKGLESTLFSNKPILDPSPTQKIASRIGFGLKLGYADDFMFGKSRDIGKDNFDYANFYSGYIVGVDAFYETTSMRYAIQRYFTREIVSNNWVEPNFEPATSIRQFNLVAGPKWGNARNRIFIQSGIGWINGTTRGSDFFVYSELNEFITKHKKRRFQKIALPITFGWRSGRHMSETGIDLYANINSEKIFWGLMFTMDIGVTKVLTHE